MWLITRVNDRGCLWGRGDAEATMGLETWRQNEGDFIVRLILSKCQSSLLNSWGSINTSRISIRENTEGQSPAARLWIRVEHVTAGTHQASRQDSQVLLTLENHLFLQKLSTCHPWPWHWQWSSGALVMWKLRFLFAVWLQTCLSSLLGCFPDCFPCLIKDPDVCHSTFFPGTGHARGHNQTKQG